MEGSDKTTKHEESKKLIHAAISDALRVFKKKHHRLPKEGEKIVGRLEVHLIGAVEERGFGNVSGCFSFTTCYEDEGVGQSYCQQEVRCGEWEGID